MAAVALLAGAVAVSATVFGVGFARQGHDHEGEEAAQPAHMEEGHTEAATTGAGGGEIASAVLISLAAGALIPLTLLAVRRRERAVPEPELGIAEPVATAGIAQILVALLSVGAAVIHFAVIAQHFDEWWLPGMFFVGSAVFQLVWASLVLVRPTIPVYAVGALVNAAIVVTWIMSRTTGVPFGPEAGEPEAVGLPDTVATGFEIALVVLVVPLMTACAIALPQRPLARLAGTWASAAVVLSLTALALAILA